MYILSLTNYYKRAMMPFLKVLSALFLVLASCSPQIANAEIVVIVNPANPVEQLTREQVIDIYMGRYTHFPDGHAALPLDQAENSYAREMYYKKLINKSVAQVNAFWSRLLFSGRATPPKELQDAQAVISQVLRNRSAIAYIDSQNVSDKTKVVLHLP